MVCEILTKHRSSPCRTYGRQKRQLRFCAVRRMGDTARFHRAPTVLTALEMKPEQVSVPLIIMTTAIITFELSSVRFRREDM